ncbi:hypothetical protein [Burkholderia vietnamiensis]|uniref:hypothetical protein n=1 Tax=Burkholderia vietnamiensis TaxID=60552 RepID=UPI000841A169|nr:hypothetical protein [Burkholderia vietnamiensis]AOJ17375.1 hypothetical protein WJ02_27420 [Burkholderia vietnamiensis]
MDDDMNRERMMPMKAMHDSSNGIGDLRALSYSRPAADVAARPAGGHSRRRRIVALIAAVLAIAVAQYVALKIIYATQPAHVAPRK